MRLIWFLLILLPSAAFANESLYKAVKLNNLKLVDQILQNDPTADINYIDSEQVPYTALSYASRNGFVEIVRYLVDEGADIYLTAPAFKAVNCPDKVLARSIIDILLSAGLDVNYHYNELHHKLLHKVTIVADISSPSSISFYKQLMIDLIEHGAKVDERFTWNNTVLTRTSSWGDHELIKYLVESGANVNEQGESRLTALDYAAKRGFFETVKFLIEKGAAVEPGRGLSEATPLILAAKYGHVEVAEYLISHGANVNAYSNNPGEPAWTPLFYASAGRMTSLVKELIKNGADVNHKVRVSVDVFGNDVYKTALNVAASLSNNASVVELLLEAPVDVNFATIGGCQPLAQAVKANSLESVKLLIQKGADSHSVCYSSFGQLSGYFTVESIAKNMGYVDIYEYLKKITGRE